MILPVQPGALPAVVSAPHREYCNTAGPLGAIVFAILRYISLPGPAAGDKFKPWN